MRFALLALFIPFLVSFVKASVFDHMQEAIQNGNLEDYLEELQQKHPQLKHMTGMAKMFANRPEFIEKLKSATSSMKKRALTDDDDEEEDSFDMTNLLPCEYKCDDPQNSVLAQREDWTFTPKGCKFNGFILAAIPNADQLLSLYNFDECCDTRDQCYETCGSVKKECDRAFTRCTRQKCKTDYPDAPPNPLYTEVTQEEPPALPPIDLANPLGVVRTEDILGETKNVEKNQCLEYAQMYYQATATFGCKTYLASQGSACSCVPSSSRSEL